MSEEALVEALGDCAGAAAFLCALHVHLEKALADIRRELAGTLCSTHVNGVNDGEQLVHHGGCVLLLCNFDLVSKEAKKSANVLEGEASLAVTVLDCDLWIDRAERGVRVHDDLVGTEGEEGGGAECHERDQYSDRVEALSKYGHELPRRQGIAPGAVQEDVHSAGVSNGIDLVDELTHCVSSHHGGHVGPSAGGIDDQRPTPSGRLDGLIARDALSKLH